MKLPENIRKEHILKAIQKIQEEGISANAHSSSYDLLYQGERFPPKLVIAYANIFANGEELDRHTFPGGKGTECFGILQKNGFKIIEKKEKTGNMGFDIGQMKKDIRQTGLLFEENLQNQFVCALLAKPFVILTGLAGSGKTKLAQVFAQWICGDSSQWCVVPVGADWTNREPLLGYPNALSEGEYVMPENGVLELMLQADENRNRPYFLILDEMNLSHVERYFADFLSVMESQEAIPLHPETEIWKKCRVPTKISLPPNLFIVGTVNIDETTYMFSPKVLDRANVIEFRVTMEEMERFLKHKIPVNLNAIQAGGAEMGASFVEIATHKGLQPRESEKLNDTLLHFFSRLKNAGAEFGFRSAREIYTFVAIAGRLVPDWTEDEVIDAVIMQKLLPKLHGSQRKLESILRTLGELCLNDGQNVEDYFVKDKPIAGVKYPLSLDKLVRMYKGVVNNGFVSYAEA